MHSQTNVNYTLMCEVLSTKAPSTFEEACTDEKWKEAMDLEIHSIQKNDTWDLVDLPSGKHAICNKWLYKAKFHFSGIVECHKALLVARS